MATSSSKNVKFKLEIEHLNTSENSKKLILLEDLPKEKRRNSKGTVSSFEKTRTTRISKPRLSRPSIFSSNNRLSNNLFSVRFDAYGNEIVKGSKNHKVSFIDNISHQKIAEVILIESSNNFKNPEQDKINCHCCMKNIGQDNANCQCISFCSIF